MAAERDYLTHCRALAEDLGVSKKVTWLGQIARSDKLKLLESIDVFVMPTVHPDAKGIPVIEALTAGVPVVAPNHGAFPELLDEERAGLLHVPGDPSDLARAINTLFCEPQIAVRIGGHGYALARSRHSADQMAISHEELYKSLLPV